MRRDGERLLCNITHFKFLGLIGLKDVTSANVNQSLTRLIVEKKGAILIALRIELNLE